MIVTGPDGTALFQLSDGSTFQVFPNTNVVFRKTLGDWRDLLDMLVGRVRVHIEHFWGQPNPNRVITPTAVISVRGTTFDVEVDDDNESTIIEVEEGSVDVEHALFPRGPKRLGPGDTLRVYRNAPIASSGPADKGSILRLLIRAARDWAATMGTRTARVSVPGGSGGGSVGDTGKPGPPPPPAPPPTAPPPPPIP
jgi:hypothetical protein